MNDQRIFALTLFALTCYLLILSGLFHRTYAQDGKEYTIAVLSPGGGPLQEVGRSHDKSVRRAFQIADRNSISVQDHTLRFRFLSTGDPTDTTATCVERARSAVEKDSAIAILGPVASGCTKEVLAQDLEVPVLSSLSTAKDLSGSEWFFRTIAHDDDRLTTFLNTADDSVDLDHSIAIYKPTPYGRGLLGHLMNSSKVDLDLETAHVYKWNDAIEELAHNQVALTDTFRQAMQDHWNASGHNDPIGNVFVLGSSDKTAKVLQELDDFFSDMDGDHDPSFMVVGSKQYADELPADTWLVGEAQVGTSRNLITEITSGDPSEDLYISTLDASIALREAIRDVLSQPDAVTLTPTGVRRNLRRTLEQIRFPSSERGRRVEFHNGYIADPPEIPIYRVSVSEERRAQIINPGSQESWVEIRVIEQPAGHLEGPLVVELIPHGEDLNGKDIALQIEGLGDEPVTVKEVNLDENGTRVSFVPSFFWASWFPNALTISTNETPPLDSIEVEGLSWPVSYLLAALSALFGALLYTRYDKSKKKRPDEGKKQSDEDSEAESVKSWTMGTYVERCLAGLVIAFLIIHVGPLLEGEPLLSQIPIPQFGSSQWLNAVLSGLLGGWVGLNPIMSLVAGVVGALTPLFQSDS